MMNLFRRLLKSDKRPAETFFTRPPDPSWMGRGYLDFAREGYRLNPYVFRAVSIIARSLAGIPWLLYAAQKDGPQEIYDHPALDLLRKPNPQAAFFDFVEEITSHLLIAGELFVVALPEKGRAVELWPLRPDMVKIERNQDGTPKAYIYDGGKEIRYTPEQVLHLRFWHPTSDRGLSPLEAASHSVDMNNAGRAWNVALLQNGAVPAGALSYEGTLSEVQREALRRQFNERHRGVKKAGNVLLLEGGLKYEPIGMDAREVSWLDGLKVSAREVAIAYGVPPELLGDSENKTYSNYQEARKAFYTETVLPLLDKLVGEFSEFVLPREGGSARLFFAYDPDQIEALAEDRDKVWKRAETGVAHSFLTPNEAREMLGYSRVEGGDVLLIPASVVPVDAPEKMKGVKGQKGLPTPDPEKRSAYWERFDVKRLGPEGVASKRFEKQLEKDRRDIVKAIREGGDWGAVLDAHEGDWLKLIGAVHYAVSEEFAKQTTVELLGEKALKSSLLEAVGARVAAWLAGEGAKRVRGITETTRRQVANALAEGVAEGEDIPAIARRVSTAMKRTSRTRAITIARTEVVSASNHGSLIGAEESGLDLVKEWVATPDDRTRDDHRAADGQRAPLDGTFSIGGWPMEYPGDGSHGAPGGEIINCRCAVAYRRK